MTTKKAKSMGKSVMWALRHVGAAVADSVPTFEKRAEAERWFGQTPKEYNYELVRVTVEPEGINEMKPIEEKENSLEEKVQDMSDGIVSTIEREYKIKLKPMDVDLIQMCLMGTYANGFAAGCKAFEK